MNRTSSKATCASLPDLEPATVVRHRVGRAWYHELSTVQAGNRDFPIGWQLQRRQYDAVLLLIDSLAIGSTTSHA